MKRAPKRFRFVLVAVTLLALTGTSLYGQGQAQSQSPSPERSRSDEMLEWWNHIGNKLIAMAKDFPEDKYDFKLQKDERTFAENLLHVAAVDYDVAGKVSKSHLGPDFGKDKHSPVRDAYRTKADVVKLLEEAVAAGATVIQEQGDAGLDRTMEFAWETGKHVAHNSYVWMSAIEHSAEHFGQLVVYYRANNLVPPESRRSAQQSQQSAAPRMVDLKAPDGTLLKASYFAAAKPGPGVLLFHQSNRTRTSWDDVARPLAAAGINTLEIDDRAHGESGGKDDFWSNRDHKEATQQQQADLETAFQFLVSQPGVQRDLIGLGGAGLLGVDNAVQTARLHPADIKSLVLMSGETFRPGIEFLHQASQLPELFVVADTDEYPPTVEAMLLLYARASSPSRKLIHYSAPQEAPWLWFEPTDIGKVPATGGHGTDLFKDHPDLPGIIVDWFVTTLIKTPGHAPADPLAAAPILNQLAMPGGPAQVTQQLMEARQRDPKAQLFPEISASIIGFDFQRIRDFKSAIEVLRLVQIAYPDSAEAMDNLADVYLADGQKTLARQYAQQALTLVDAHKVPLSSWTDTDQHRAETRRDLEDVLKKTAQ